MLEIKNEFINAGFRLKGAELASLRTREREYLWSGDPAYWDRQSPLLFPIVGKLKDDRTLISGKFYFQNKHGFLCDLPFKVISKNDDEIIFRNTYSEETLRKYPFKYRMDVVYKLEGKSLSVIHRIKNNDDAVMPYNIGAHPGINCPLYPDESFEDYAIHFEKPESFSSPKVEEGGLLNLKESLISFRDLEKLDLKHELFGQDALIILNVRSEWAALLNKKGKGIKMHFPGFKTFAIWSPSRKKAPLICLEPWIGYPDTVDSDYDFLKKADLIFLKPEETAEIGFRLEIID